MGKNSRGNIEFAFGSSAPRLIEPRIDSSSGYWGSRSVTGPGMFERSQRSMEREVGAGWRFQGKEDSFCSGIGQKYRRRGEWHYQWVRAHGSQEEDRPGPHDSDGQERWDVKKWHTKHQA